MGASFDPGDYGPVFASLIESAPTPPLDAGPPRGDTAAALVDRASAFATAAVQDAGMADCCVAGVWLLYNELDRAHTLCQDVPTASGSYWHGVVHRREGDFGNAGYWFARCNGHPAIDAIAAAVAADPAASRAFPAGWTPEAMVAACRRGLGGETSLHEGCLAAQQIEWRILFDHCYQAAVG